VRRHKGRSALVVALVLLPVLAVTFGLALQQTNDVSPAERLDWDLGTADARLTAAAARVPVRQTPTGAYWEPADLTVSTSSDDAAPWAASELLAALPDGSRVVPVTPGVLRFPVAGGVASAQAWLLDLADPLTAGMVTWHEGRPARSAAEVVVNPLMVRRGFGVGSRLTTEAGHDLTVVGVAERPASLQDEQVWLQPGSAVAADAGQATGAEPDWLVDAPAAVTWDEVRQLNAAGLVVLSRQVVLDPPPMDPVLASRGMDDAGMSSASGAEVAVLGLVAVSVVLEVVLLAGPAFAVGARRRERDLAQVVATGGEPRDVRRVVLAGGLVLGAGAALAGALLGIGLAWLAVPALEPRLGSRMGPFDVPWLPVAAATVVGAAAAVLAALLPARSAARLDVVAALAGRRPAPRTRAGWPLVGLLLIGVGVAATLTGVHGDELGIAGGAVLLVVGTLMLVPTVLRLLGRLAPRLPLSARLAVRDAARSSARTAPAVAAVLAAVAGITALAIGGASDVEENRREYVPETAAGVTSVLLPASTLSASGDPTPAEAAAAAATVQRLLPGAEPVLAREIAWDSGFCEPGDRCRVLTPEPGSGDATAYSAAVLDDDGSTLALRADLDPDQRAAAAAALADGRAVVLQPGWVVDGTLRIGVGQDSCDSLGSCDQQRVGTVTLPAVDLSAGLPAQSTFGALPTSAAAALDATPSAAQLLVGPAATPTPEQEQALTEALPDAFVHVERGFQETFTLPLLLLAGLGTLIVLGATLLATGLAAVDARPDLATLAAVGAAPGTRRRLSMAQAGVVGLLGAGLGVLAGFLPGWAVTFPLTTSSYSGVPGSDVAVLDVPWLLLGFVAVGVPLLAMLAAGLLTPSRLPLVRRLE
jgi:putative ABC transport system permease protein